MAGRWVRKVNEGLMATVTQHVSFGRIILKYWWRHLIILVLIYLFIQAGFWQLRRLDQRRALNAEILAGLNRSPVALTGAPVDPEALDHQRVIVTGSYDNDKNMIQRTQSYQGRAGVDLIVPLQIAGTDQAVLVNRGWIPFDDFEPEARVKYLVEGQVTVEGMAHQTQLPPSRFAPSDPDPQPGEWHDAWFRIDIDRIQHQLDAPLLPIYIEALPGSVPDESPPLREPIGDTGEGNHFNYALQWFSFALILTVTYAGFTWQEYKKKGIHSD